MLTEIFSSKRNHTTLDLIDGAIPRFFHGKRIRYDLVAANDVLLPRMPGQIWARPRSVEEFSAFKSRMRCARTDFSASKAVAYLVDDHVG